MHQYHHHPYRPGQQPQNLAQQRHQRLPEISEITHLVVRETKHMARRYPYVMGFYLLGVLVLGLLVVSGGNNGRPMTPLQQQQYHHIMDNIDIEGEYQAEVAMWSARQQYQASQGWFWSCDTNCQRYKKKFQAAEDKYQRIRATTMARVKAAKAVAGVTSEMAVTEIQNSFWRFFTAGKQSAVRRTMWDMVWMMIRSAMGNRSRDEGTAEYIVRIVLHLLMNFTIGLIMALGMFIFSLWGIINSYQPNPIVAVLMFLAAAAAGFAFVATYLLAIAGASFGSIYGMAKLAESQQRIGAAGGQRPAQRIYR